jgi:hypothetical protein
MRAVSFNARLLVMVDWCDSCSRVRIDPSHGSHPSPFLFFLFVFLSLSHLSVAIVISLSLPFRLSCGSTIHHQSPHRVPLYNTKQWVLGSAGQSCTQACGLSSCNPQPPKGIDTKVQMEYALNVALITRTCPFVCDSTTSDGNPANDNQKNNSPYVLSGTDTCVWTPGQGGGGCGNSDSNFQRLCCCGNAALCTSPCTTDADCAGLTNPPSAYSVSLLCCIAAARTTTATVFSHHSTLPTALALTP